MIYNVTIFGLHLKINPVAFTLPIGNGWSIYWYGIIIALGFLLAVVYGMKMCKKLEINQDKLLDAIIITTPVSILCARTYYLIFDGQKLSGIGEFFGFDGAGFSGLAIYGGVIGAAICGLVLCRLLKLNLLDCLDLAGTAFLIGQGIGRWGNFTNQEAFGAATGSSFFGMTSENVAAELGEGRLAHPCFLYESIWCIAGFFILNRLLHNRKYKGQAALAYGAWYGLGRAIIEPLRTDSLMLSGARVSFLLSLALCIACTVALLVIHYRRRESGVDSGEYVPIYSDITENAEETENSEKTDSDSEEPEDDENVQAD